MGYTSKTLDQVQWQTLYGVQPMKQEYPNDGQYAGFALAIAALFLAGLAVWGMRYVG
jgi:hypothetical protein